MNERNSSAAKARNLIAAALAVLSAGAPSPGAQAAKLSAKEIMQKNEDARKIDDVRSSATLATGGGGSPDRLKQFTWWRKLTSDKIHFNTLTRFHAPAEVRGEGILFLERDNDENEVMMYLPAFKKIRRVESQAQSGSFMGSEFSYADIATPHVNDYDHKLLRDEPCPGGGNGKVRCHVVEAVPVNENVKERTGYSRTVNWVRQDNFMSVQGEFYNAEGGLFKTLSASEIKEVDPARRKWMAHHVRVENLKSKRFTVLKFLEVKVNGGIPDSTFSQQNLARDR